jgi:hypothetical protein
LLFGINKRRVKELKFAEVCLHGVERTKNDRLIITLPTFIFSYCMVVMNLIFSNVSLTLTGLCCIGDNKKTVHPYIIGFVLTAHPCIISDRESCLQPCKSKIDQFVL